MFEIISAVNNSPESVAATILSSYADTSIADIPPKAKPPLVSDNYLLPDDEILYVRTFPSFVPMIASTYSPPN